MLHLIIARCRPYSDEGVDCPPPEPNPTVIGGSDPAVIMKSGVVNAQTKVITMEEYIYRERVVGGSTMLI